MWLVVATFGAIADRYVQYLNNKYGQDIAVIFDGFPDDDKKSTKNCERLRRAAHFSPDSCENPMPVILDNESEDGDAPATIDMVDEQLECEDIE
ncbi:hypothetical protein AVEN_157329-1, partial [Araneus ventricosus]